MVDEPVIQGSSSMRKGEGLAASWSRGPETRGSNVKRKDASPLRCLMVRAMAKTCVMKGHAKARSPWFSLVLKIYLFICDRIQAYQRSILCLVCCKCRAPLLKPEMLIQTLLRRRRGRRMLVLSPSTSMQNRLENKRLGLVSRE